MDINMPDLDGYELCRLLRQSSLLQSIPIVMLTGRDGIVDRLRARVAGATDYMTKPIHAQNLIELVNKLLNRTEV
jgi:twitching motility two-component system response regulator PilG